MNPEQPEKPPFKPVEEPRTEPFKPLKTDEHTLLRERRATDRSAPEEPELALVAYAGEALGRVFPLREGRYILGRSAHCEIPLMDGEVSRQHAALTVTPGPAGLKVQVEDLKSTNGTRLNEREVQGAMELMPEDRIQLGGHVFKLVVLDALERAFHQTLLEQGTKDALTGLSNRRAIMGELGSRFQVAQRYGRPFSVILCDLDFFKGVNDTHGHPAGDAVLRIFAEVTAQTFREPDMVGRIGGEEFLVLLPETDSDGALVGAERLRRALEATPVDIGGGTLLRVTCSLGVAARREDDTEPGALVGRADAALYKAKAAGRNRSEA
ncbi:MAG TPA: GGDEF domain-containing protein [Holophagaceae bacterium]|nr:GGDEF domain-containing protein [Holophagaceae bacterium]